MTERASGGVIPGPVDSADDRIPIVLGTSYCPAPLDEAWRESMRAAMVAAQKFADSFRRLSNANPALARFMYAMTMYGSAVIYPHERWNRHPDMAPRVPVPVKPSARSRRRTR